LRRLGRVRFGLWYAAGLGLKLSAVHRTKRKRIRIILAALGALFHRS
jgi:hypothetical protein